MFDNILKERDVFKFHFTIHKQLRMQNTGQKHLNIFCFDCIFVLQANHK